MIEIPIAYLLAMKNVGGRTWVLVDRDRGVIRRHHRNGVVPSRQVENTRSLTSESLPALYSKLPSLLHPNWTRRRQSLIRVECPKE
jgi:hypothetical protein